MFPIRTILAPTDFSPHAEGAVRYACDLAERLGAGLHLLHVLSEVMAFPGEWMPGAADPLLVPVLPPDFYAESEQAARKGLGRLPDPSWGRPASVESFVRRGEPVEAIAGHAAAHAIDLIVISTHGRTGLSHALLGSVAERIVREAPCPVLTVRDRRSP